MAQKRVTLQVFPQELIGVRILRYEGPCPIKTHNSCEFAVLKKLSGPISDLHFVENGSKSISTSPGVHMSMSDRVQRCVSSPQTCSSHSDDCTRSAQIGSQANISVDLAK